MKLLVLAHTPPPFHGQSYMVRLFLDCFMAAQESNDSTDPAAGAGALPEGRSSAVECLHIDFRLSSSIDDIGQRRWTKLLLTLRFCVRAVVARFRSGADTLLYVPAPALRHAIYRDWLVMTCCRPFFRRRVFWWHAAGLGAWLRAGATPWERWITRRLLGCPDLSLVLGAETRRDAQELASRRIALVPNAIPDPCPRSAAELVREKSRRRSAGRALPQASPPGLAPTGIAPARFRLLFIGLCYREKGLFDAVEAVSRVNRRLATRPFRVQLDVAGRFFLPEEQREFEDRIRRPDLLDLSSRSEASSRPGAPPEAAGIAAVRYHGFVADEAKHRLFCECDCLIFPTYYAAESFGLVLLEAMAYGMDIIATRWHNIPELLPPDYPGLVTPRDPAGLDAAIDCFLERYDGERLRHHYEQNFAMAEFRTRVEAALRTLDPA